MVPHLEMMMGRATVTGDYFHDIHLAIVIPLSSSRDCRLEICYFGQ